MDWLNAQDPTNLYLSAITAAELIFGVQAVPEEKRRDGLIRAVMAILEEDFPVGSCPSMMRRRGSTAHRSRPRARRATRSRSRIGRSPRSPSPGQARWSRPAIRCRSWRSVPTCSTRRRLSLSDRQR
ncbi:PIN domain-containing protein [Limimaricola variabilis]|uniref:hypothetical protein n=1 Tax=Limimaricola variabilis TaxID=1492771 RepID=UPI0038995900